MFSPSVFLRTRNALEIRDDDGDDDDGELKQVKGGGVSGTYFSNLVLHIISSLQLTKIAPVSASVSRPDSDMGL